MRNIHLLKTSDVRNSVNTQKIVAFSKQFVKAREPLTATVAGKFTEVCVFSPPTG